MVLAAPELVIAEPVELLDEVEIAAELQHRMLAHRMVRGEKGAEIQTRHHGLLLERGGRHSRESGNPEGKHSRSPWTPACAGVTINRRAIPHPRRSADPDPRPCRGP